MPVVKEDVLWFEISMSNTYFMQVLNPIQQLVKELTSLLFSDLFVINYVLVEFSFLHELHNQQQLLRSLHNFVQLNDVRVSDEFQDVYLSFYSLYISYILYFLLFQDFDRNIFPCLFMSSELHLTKCTRSNRLS